MKKWVQCGQIKLDIHFFSFKASEQILQSLDLGVPRRKWPKRSLSHGLENIKNAESIGTEKDIPLIVVNQSYPICRRVFPWENPKAHWLSLVMQYKIYWMYVCTYTYMIMNFRKKSSFSCSYIISFLLRTQQQNGENSALYMFASEAKC